MVHVACAVLSSDPPRAQPHLSINPSTATQEVTKVLTRGLRVLRLSPTRLDSFYEGRISRYLILKHRKAKSKQLIESSITPVHLY